MNYLSIQKELLPRNRAKNDTSSASKSEQIFVEDGAYIARRQQYIEWLSSPELGLSVGLTLMPKRFLTQDSLYAASMRFYDILNRLVYKNAYKRQYKKLTAVLAIEGKKSLKQLHPHFAIKPPAEISIEKFCLEIKNAIHQSGDFLIYTDEHYRAKKSGINIADDEKYHYKIDIVDRGWLRYITKESDTKRLENIFVL